MSQPYTMISDEKGSVGVTILDKGGEAFADINDPALAGWTVKIESSDPTVVGVTMRPDGLSADLSSDNIGKANITVSTTKADGTHLGGSPDVTEVTVKNAVPGSQNVTFAVPVPE